MNKISLDEILTQMKRTHDKYEKSPPRPPPLPPPPEPEPESESDDELLVDLYRSRVDSRKLVDDIIPDMVCEPITIESNLSKIVASKPFK